MDLSKLVLGWSLVLLTSQLTFASAEKIENKLSEILLELKNDNFDIDEEIERQNAMVEEILDRKAMFSVLHEQQESDQTQNIHIKFLDKKNSAY